MIYTLGVLIGEELVSNIDSIIDQIKICRSDKNINVREASEMALKMLKTLKKKNCQNENFSSPHKKLNKKNINADFLKNAVRNEI